MKTTVFLFRGCSQNRDYHLRSRGIGAQNPEQAEAQIVSTLKIRRRRFLLTSLYCRRSPEPTIPCIDPETSLHPNPVPETHLASWGAMTWLYGRRSKDRTWVGATRIQSEHLENVISSPDSLVVFRAGFSLERSFAVAIGDKRTLPRSDTECQNRPTDSQAPSPPGIAGTGRMGYSRRGHNYRRKYPQSYERWMRDSMTYQTGDRKPRKRRSEPVALRFQKTQLIRFNLRTGWNYRP